MIQETFRSAQTDLKGLQASLAFHPGLCILVRAAFTSGLPSLLSYETLPHPLPGGVLNSCQVGVCAADPAPLVISLESHLPLLALGKNLARAEPRA